MSDTDESNGKRRWCKQSPLDDTHIGDKDFRVQRALIDAQALQKLHAQTVGIVILEV